MGTRLVCPDRNWLRKGVVLACALLVCACQSQGTPPVAIQPPNPACVVSQAPARSSITIGVLQPIDTSRAPIPVTVAERLVFRQMYETLVGVDCAGQVVPLLAESWTSSAEGTEWQFRIRNGARFRDGSFVTARDIADSWSGRDILPIVSISVVSEREMQVRFSAPILGPDRFADPALAIAPRGNRAGPLGSGAYRLEPPHDSRTSLLVVNTPSTVIPQSLVFRTFASGDAPAALDAGVDAIVTGDGNALEYARALRDYTATPIGWNRTYVLATPNLSRSEAAVPIADADAALIGQAVRAELRPTAAPFWWQRADCRPATPEAVRIDTRSRTIAYPLNDPIARGIAERLVALAWPVPRAPAWLGRELGANYASLGSPTAVGLDDRALLETVRSRRALAVVAPLARTAGATCIANDALATALLAEWRIIPLVDTRDYLIHKEGIGRTVVDGDGVIRFAAGVR